MEATRNFKITLVDDDLFNLTVMNEHLTQLGYTGIVMLQNGIDCLNRLTEKPEVVFLDHNMDGMTGFEVLKKIKRFDPNIFVVMISGQESMKTAVDSLKYGAFDYIIKGEEVLKRITDVMHRISIAQEALDKAQAPVWKKILSRI